MVTRTGEDTPSSLLYKSPNGKTVALIDWRQAIPAGADVIIGPKETIIHRSLRVRLLVIGAARVDWQRAPHYLGAVLLRSLCEVRPSVD